MRGRPVAGRQAFVELADTPHELRVEADPCVETEAPSVGAPEGDPPDIAVRNLPRSGNHVAWEAERPRKHAGASSRYQADRSRTVDAVRDPC